MQNLIRVASGGVLALVLAVSPAVSQDAGDAPQRGFDRNGVETWPASPRQFRLPSGKRYTVEGEGSESCRVTVKDSSEDPLFSYVETHVGRAQMNVFVPPEMLETVEEQAFFTLSTETFPQGQPGDFTLNEATYKPVADETGRTFLQGYLRRFSASNLVWLGTLSFQQSVAEGGMEPLPGSTAFELTLDPGEMDWVMLSFGNCMQWVKRQPR